MICDPKLRTVVLSEFIKEVDVGRKTLNETLKKKMDLTKDDWINMYIILKKTTHNLFNCSKTCANVKKMIITDVKKYFTCFL